jgi:hypothetical protein
LSEVKFDGFRGQLHKRGDEVTIFTRKGKDYTARFPSIRHSLLVLPTQSAIMDAKLSLAMTMASRTSKLFWRAAHRTSARGVSI